MKLLVLFLLPLASYSQEPCKSFRHGKFYTETPVMGRTEIIRYDSIQEEVNKASGYHYVHKVSWLSDCEYTLELLENKSSDPKFNPPVPIGKFLMTVRLIKIAEDLEWYEVEANLNGGEFRYGGVIRKSD